ncbi:unnamed protein product [Darwinula stevensoni]|uniref:Cytosolic carboxypeptidase N-terminal domain-containing protein n=1 Tax=Darwinula stevensoni TaxID=69355 RepID=A0A7R9FTF5_9CRUS|nr:unnamed protein product [Darwinula stevensoni]CAG0904552.1 unnamed protein product [Darwinula stevensoni]
MRRKWSGRKSLIKSDRFLANKKSQTLLGRNRDLPDFLSRPTRKSQGMLSALRTLVRMPGPFHDPVVLRSADLEVEAGGGDPQNERETEPCIVLLPLPLRSDPAQRVDSSGDSISVPRDPLDPEYHLLYDEYHQSGHRTGGDPEIRRSGDPGLEERWAFLFGDATAKTWLWGQEADVALESRVLMLPSKDGVQYSGSDSDAEGGLGNVIRMVMRPPGHSGKAKRGHLCFDASFEGGNLGRVDFITEYEYDLFIRPDTCNPRFRVWFNFVVDNVRSDQRVIFNLVNLSKTKLLYRDGMTPLVKSTSRPKWQRVPHRFTYYHKSPEHRNHYVLSFAFAFDKDDDVYQFSFGYPYTYSKNQSYLDQVEKKKHSHVTRTLLAQSVVGFPLLDRVFALTMIE